MSKWGGPRAGSGRWSRAELEAIAAGARDEDIAAMRGRTVEAVRRKRAALNGETPAPAPRRKRADAIAAVTLPATVAAEPKRAMTANSFLEAIARSNADAARRKVATSQELNPFQLPVFPPGSVPKDDKLKLAMDENTTWGNQQWAGAVLNGVNAQGLLFMGYPFLAELTQRPEYRVISETIADDATRKFIDFEVTGDEDENADGKQPGGGDKPRDPETGAPLERDDPDERKKKIEARGKTDKVKALKDELARLEVRDRFYAVARDDGFFGRSQIFLDFGDPLDGGNNPELRTPIGDGRDTTSRAKVGKNALKRLQVVEAMFAYPLAYNASQPLAETWYNPEFWYVMASEVHQSRMPVFVGHPVPAILKPAYAFGGLSLTQLAMPYVNIWLRTRDSVGALIHSFSVMVLMTDLQSFLQPSAGAPDLMTRVNLFNALRDNQGAFVLNKATEDFKNVSASLAGLHELQAQAQEHIASVSRIPLVKLTGISPSGLNASSEGEIRVYYDTIAAYQNRFFRAHLTRIINFMQLSLWGDIDPEITFEFEPLWELSQKEKSEKEKDDADRDQKYVDMGAFGPGEIRKIKIDDPTLPYTGLDPEDVPDLEQEEEQGLEPEGGRPQPIVGQEQGEGEPPEGAKGEDEQPATPRAKTGLPWGDQFEWMRGYQLPARRVNGDAVVRTPLGGSASATKGLRVGSRVRYERADGEGGQGRIFGFAAGADGAVSVGVLDTDNDRALFLPEGSVAARPVLSQDERGRGGDTDADVLPFGRDVDPLFAADEGGEWNEGDHPRAPDGKFGKGGGGGGKAAHAPQFGVQHGLFTASHGGSGHKPTASVAPNISSTPLDPKALKRVGAQMGSNPGGVFEDATGKKFYVKKPQSKAHVRNEMIAAALYGLAGSPTLRYRPVEGGEHVATEMSKLDKDRAQKLSPDEREEAQREFAVHAWLGNYDAVGTGGDNLGTIGGVPTALDLGGALEYRAQGKPKGAAFGDKVTEMQSMRDAKIAPDATKIFGEMTPAQLRESARYVTRIPDKAIRATVEKMGGDAALADKLIARRDDIADQAKTFGAEGAPAKATSAVVFASGDDLPVKELNGVPFKAWSPPKDWATVDGQNDDIGEPELPDLKGKSLSTGLVIREPDGRVWLARPTNGYGDYEHTFPKGRAEKDLSLQANAIKEAFEETGLKGRISGFAGDHVGDTTVTRLYYADRETGDPSRPGWESDGVVLAPANKLDGFLNRTRDRDVAKKLAGDAEFNEADHPRGKGGKFATTAGGGSEDPELTTIKMNPSPDPLSPEALKAKYGENIFNGGETPPQFKSKKEHAAHLLSKGVTTAHMLKALGWPSISMPAMAKSLGMKLEKTNSAIGTIYKGTPMTAAEIAAQKAAAKQAKKEKKDFAPDPNYDPKANEKKVEETLQKAQIVAKAAAQAVAAIQAKATPQELEKAKKTVPLQLQYVPGAPKTAAAQNLVDEFNKKYADKPTKTQAELEKKVADFKELKAQTDVMAAIEQGKTAAQAQAEMAAKQKADAEAAAKLSATLKAQAEEAAQKNKAVMDALGITSAEATGFNALVQMLGGSQADAVQSFKKYEEKAKGYGYPVTGFQAALIGNYTNGGYSKINNALRGGSWTEAQHVYVKLVNKALQAMPTYKGTVKRGTDLTKETQGLYKVGHVVEERAFTSTSVTKPWGGNTKFTVTAIGKRGAHVRKLSSHPGEDEVVFSARTFFRVTKVEGQPGGHMHVHMEEVED